MSVGASKAGFCCRTADNVLAVARNNPDPELRAEADAVAKSWHALLVKMRRAEPVTDEDKRIKQINTAPVTARSIQHVYAIRNKRSPSPDYGNTIEDDATAKRWRELKTAAGSTPTKDQLKEAMTLLGLGPEEIGELFNCSDEYVSSTLNILSEKEVAALDMRYPRDEDDEEEEEEEEDDDDNDKEAEDDVEDSEEDEDEDE